MAAVVPIDTKLGKMPTFSGQESDWTEWKFQAKAYLGLMSQAMLTHLAGAELAGADRLVMEDMNAVAQQDGRVL